MKPVEYLQQIGMQTGLNLAPGVSPIKADPLLAYKAHGTIIGERDGYVVAISMVNIGNQSRLGIMIRYPKLTDCTALQADLKTIPGIKGFLKTKELKVANDGVVLLWTYAFRPPKAPEVIQTFDDLMSKISTYCSRFTGKCEDCGEGSVPGIVLYNDVPGYHCSNCQAKIAGQQAVASQEYDRRSSNYGKAIGASTLVAIGCAFAQGYLLYWMSDQKGTPVKLWAALALLVGMAVGKTFSKTIGKIEVLPQAPVVVLLTLVATLAGDILFFTLYVAPIAHVAKSMALVQWVTFNLWKFKTAGFMDWIVVLCQVGGAAFAVTILKKDRPQFTPVFRPLSSTVLATARA